MDRKAAKDNKGTVIAFPADQNQDRSKPASAGPRRRPPVERRTEVERLPVEELLDSLKGRRVRLEDRLALISLAIQKLEVQVETKRNLEILPGIS